MTVLCTIDIQSTKEVNFSAQKLALLVASQRVDDEFQRLLLLNDVSVELLD